MWPSVAHNPIRVYDEKRDLLAVVVLRAARARPSSSGPALDALIEPGQQVQMIRIARSCIPVWSSTVQAAGLSRAKRSAVSIEEVSKALTSRDGSACGGATHGDVPGRVLGGAAGRLRSPLVHTWSARPQS